MTELPGFVFDTNVLISALLLPDSAPARAVQTSLRTGVILLSAPTLREIEEVVFRPKFDRYVSFEDRQQFLALLTDTCRPVAASESFRVCRDPRDDKFLDLAIAGHAKAIITGDEDLLSMSPFRGVPIMTPAAFLDRSS